MTGQLRCFSSAPVPSWKTEQCRANSLICDDIVLHILTRSSDKDFVKAEAARTMIFPAYKEHAVPALNLCDQVEATLLEICVSSEPRSTKATLFLFEKSEGKKFNDISDSLTVT